MGSAEYAMRKGLMLLFAVGLFTASTGHAQSTFAQEEFTEDDCLSSSV